MIKNDGRFKKGFTPWNKGKKGVQVSWSKGLKGYTNGGSFKVGHKFTSEMLSKISESQKKRLAINGHPFKGKHHTEESNKKNRIAHLGEKSFLWHGGISFEPYSLEWNNVLKEQIRTRDGRKCMECGYTQDKLGYKLAVHHINYNKKDCRPENLISLCKSCHSQTLFKREEWTNYFNKKLTAVSAWS